VTLVFGGDSQLSLNKNALLEACASYGPVDAQGNGTTIPTALYGLKTTLGSGANTARAETGCVTAVNGCDVVSATNGNKPTSYFEGFAYAPLASVNIAVNNTAQPFFNFGIVARKLTVLPTGSVPAAVIFISLPDNSPATAPRIRSPTSPSTCALARAHARPADETSCELASISTTRQGPQCGGTSRHNPELEPAALAVTPQEPALRLTRTRLAEAVNTPNRQ
jgi:hypothetical protein